MILPDVNVFVSAFADESPDHDTHLAWLDQTLAGGTRVALADVVVSGLLRVSTDHRIHKNPATFDDAIAFVDSLRMRRNVYHVAAGAHHWGIFKELIRRSRATGQLIPDVHIAALAIEHGCQVASSDRDFARIPGVDWFDPLD